MRLCFFVDLENVCYQEEGELEEEESVEVNRYWRADGEENMVLVRGRKGNYC